MRRLLSLFLLSAAACAADDVKLTADERRAESEWLASLGLKVPEGGPLLEQPFSAPFTKRSLLSPTAWWRVANPQQVAASALRQDLPLMRALMEKAYGGWDSAVRRGWDWNRWFADWDRDLAAKGDTQLAIADAFAPIARLMQVQLDNHTGLAGGTVRFGSGSRSAVLAGAPSGECTAIKTEAGETAALDPKDPAQRPIRARILGEGARLNPGFYLSYPARRGKASAVQCGAEWIAARTWEGAGRMDAIGALARQPGNKPSYRVVSEDIGYLRLPTFSKENNELLRKLLPSLPVSAGHEKLVIIDLRQNDGGDAALNEASRWLDPSSIKAAMPPNRRQPKSCVYDALRWGYTQVTSQGLKPPLSAALLRSLQGALDGLFQPAPDGCPVTLEEVKAKWDYRQHRFPSQPPAGKPQLMLLVDNGCGSDCEFMTYALAAEPGSVIVGESTFGVGQFIQPGYFILPRTRMKFRIALGMSDMYGDGRSFDGYGLNVDVVLPGEESHKPESILKLAEALVLR